MKHFILVLCCSFLLSCGSNKSFQSFFNTYKKEVGVTAFQVPNFMRTLLGSISPEMNGIFNNINDFKFITFNKISLEKQTEIINQMNAITSNNYTDILRQNTPEQTKILSVIEDGDVVRKAIVFNSSLDKTSIFYLKGSFDPNQLKKFSENNQFDNLAGKLLQEYKSPQLLNQPILAPNLL